jgi:hypothetical protein
MHQMPHPPRKPDHDDGWAPPAGATNYSPVGNLEHLYQTAETTTVDASTVTTGHFGQHVPRQMTDSVAGHDGVRQCFGRRYNLPPKGSMPKGQRFLQLAPNDSNITLK